MRVSILGRAFCGRDCSRLAPPIALSDYTMCRSFLLTFWPILEEELDEPPNEPTVEHEPTLTTEYSGPYAFIDGVDPQVKELAAMLGEVSGGTVSFFEVYPQDVPNQKLAGESACSAGGVRMLLTHAIAVVCAEAPNSPGTACHCLQALWIF